jgi:hypothetical protein
VCGHLTEWYLRWAGQPELDAGIWFRPSLNEIGAWAGVPDADVKWGRALLAAGYVGLLKDLYPEPLGSLRKGYAALDGAGGVMLDEIIGLHRRRANAAMLVVYVLDRRVRAKWAHVLRVDAAALEGSGQIPAGWLEGHVDGARWNGEGGGAEEGRTVGRSDGALVGRSDGGTVGRMDGRMPEAAEVRKTVVGFAGVPSGAHTGGAPNPEMLRVVREHKYSDPLRALLALDNSELAERKWRAAISKDAEKVRIELGALVETDARFYMQRVPSAVLMANFNRAGLLDKA